MGSYIHFYARHASTVGWFCMYLEHSEIRKSSTSPGGIQEILFNATSTIGFDKKGYSVDDLDLRVTQDIIGIDQDPICKNDEMHELFRCYINIYTLEVPRDPQDVITFYVKILECLEQEGFQI